MTLFDAIYGTCTFCLQAYNGDSMGKAQTISTTDFDFPGQKNVYHGKVRDVYFIQNDYLVMIATDRISAFDVILPKAIPYKGQLLNQLANHFLTQTADIVPNWLISIPDPNVSFGYQAKPFKIEMVVRGSLVGSAARAYKKGDRELCGVPLPDGLEEFDKFADPIITPSTKADEGHDENISPAEIFEQQLATEEEFEQLSQYSLALFARGQEMAAERGLVLVDTKYEFGKINDIIYLIDEIHTPDSSRYFYADSYEKYLGGDKSEPPRHLSKEFVREWLIEKGFTGQKGQKIPKLDNTFVTAISNRYIELYEKLTGDKFEKPADDTDIFERIKANITPLLKDL
jgi:phosphoribosylaminoimidazole-succinocarboxamide synthase